MTVDTPFNRHRAALADAWFAIAAEGVKDTYVYRYFDADDCLIYVGQTTSPTQRDRTHRSRAWFADVARRDVTGPFTRQIGLGLENLAIVTEKPVHNRQRQNGYTGPGSLAWDEYISRELDRLDAEQPGYAMDEMRYALQAVQDAILGARVETAA